MDDELPAVVEVPPGERPLGANPSRHVARVSHAGARPLLCARALVHTTTSEEIGQRPLESLREFGDARSALIVSVEHLEIERLARLALACGVVMSAQDGAR